MKLQCRLDWGVSTIFGRLTPCPRRKGKSKSSKNAKTAPQPSKPASATKSAKAKINAALKATVGNKHMQRVDNLDWLSACLLGPVTEFKQMDPFQAPVDALFALSDNMLGESVSLDHEFAPVHFAPEAIASHFSSDEATSLSTTPNGNPSSPFDFLPNFDNEHDDLFSDVHSMNLDVSMMDKVALANGSTPINGLLGANSRDTHNAMERIRRIHIRHSFESLGNQMPGFGGKKSSSFSVLDAAAKEIHALQAREIELIAAKAELKKQNDALIAQNAALQAHIASRNASLPN